MVRVRARASGEPVSGREWSGLDLTAPALLSSAVSGDVPRSLLLSREICQLDFCLRSRFPDPNPFSMWTWLKALRHATRPA